MPGLPHHLLGRLSPKSQKPNPKSQNLTRIHLLSRSPLPAPRPTAISIDYAELCRRLEIPDCGCPCKPLDCAEVFGCELRRKGKPCDCLTILPEPCPHIRAAVHKLSIDKWSRLLILVYPADYTEPPLPEDPHQVLGKRARVAVMIQRAAIEKSGGAPRRALRHPRDLQPEQLDHVSRSVKLAGNGRPMDAGLVLSAKREAAGRPFPRLPAGTTAQERLAGMVLLSQELSGRHDLPGRDDAAFRSALAARRLPVHVPEDEDAA